jgi:hypothetical protein
MSKEAQQAAARRDIKRELRSYGIHQINGVPLRDIRDELELRVMVKYYRNKPEARPS